MPRSAAALSTLAPQGLPRKDAGLQERRSAETRQVILEATIRCLARHGYSKTTTTLVASEARASRGAMLHHYPTRQALIAATIEYAFYKRMKTFIATIRSLSESDRIERNKGIFLELRSLQSEEYQAYLELHVAARTDPELRDVFFPRAKRYDAVWRDEIAKAFPEWTELGEAFPRACELTRATLEGLMLNRDIWDDPANERVVVELLSRILTMIREGRIEVPEAS
ncbi:TetR/AcrR family transcriptional regulator [Novosphingobium marinum]|uniref:AcrR family transcriptional regulator n=1 Tax=Novosphingobium marinum TaxID=1514948 RepID=A0A7Y9XSK8_9SPHN|nr:TetR/AcrR family transcriptional regulator [Novosphingobium marinum]NYH93775.1 AcrR family transcriptional regulator [Novosphingobium marinum]